MFKRKPQHLEPPTYFADNAEPTGAWNEIVACYRETLKPRHRLLMEIATLQLLSLRSGGPKNWSADRFTELRATLAALEN